MSPKKTTTQKAKSAKRKRRKNPADSTKIVKPKVNVGKIAFESLVKLMHECKETFFSIFCE